MSTRFKSPVIIEKLRLGASVIALMLLANNEVFAQTRPSQASSKASAATLQQTCGTVSSPSSVQATDERALREAVAATRKKLGEVHPEFAKALSNLAQDLDFQGRYAEAEPLFRKALEINRAALGDDHPTTAAGYSGLAVNLNAQGRYTEAEPLLREALEIWRATMCGANPSTATAYNNLALNLDDQGRYAEAEPLSRRALEIWRASLGEAHPDTATGFHGLALNLNAQGRYAEAEPLMRKALEIWRTVLGDRHPTTAVGYSDLANNLDDQGRYIEAEPLHRKALEIWRAALGEAHPDTAKAYNSLAYNLTRQKRYVEAEPYAAKAVALARQNSDGTAAGWAPEPLRFIYGQYVSVTYGAALGQPARAAELRSAAFASIQDYTVTAAAQAQALGQARRAAELSGGAALQTLVDRQQALAGQVRALDARRTQALSGPDQALKAKLGSDYETALAALNAADAELTAKFPAYAQLISPKALDLAKVQAQLASDQGLILIAPVDKDVFVFAVSKTKVAWSRFEGGAEALAAKAAAISTSPSGPSRGAERAVTAPERFDRQAAFELYRDLIAPVEPALAGVSRLNVVSSGALGRLHLGVLLTEAPRPGSVNDDEALIDAPWLADRYAIETLTTVSGLDLRGKTTDRRATATETFPFVGYGAPFFESGSAPLRGAHATSDGATQQGSVDPDWLRSHFASLPGAAFELRAVGQSLGAPASAVHIGAAATESAVKADLELPKARILSFATFGLAAGQAPGLTEPGLVLTPPKVTSSVDDGILTASEIRNLRIAADLVILSACNDTSSDDAPISGLASAFLYAGAGAVLVSAGPVRDDTTAALISEFAMVLHGGSKSFSKALQTAMHTIRTGRRPDGSQVPGWTPQWAQPQIWGAFRLISA